VVELFVDAGDHRSLSGQLYDQVREAIVDGQLPPGVRLQPSRTVGRRLGVARSTVTEAYARLRAEAPIAAAAALRRYGVETTARARYDLRAGREDPALFPVAAWRRCTGQALAELGDHFGHYGDPPGARHSGAHSRSGWAGHAGWSPPQSRSW
jgi:GntR family transcriptional regulator / MocR family aminotransferase